MRRAGRDTAARLLALFFLALSFGARAPATADRLGVMVTPATARAGDVVLIQVPGAPPDLGGEWGGRPLRFFPVQDGLAALAGVDLEAELRPIPWRLWRPRDGATMVVGTGSVVMRPWTFPTQTLTLPRSQVDLDAKTLARVRREQAELRAALAAGGGERLWRDAFQVPVEGGEPTGGFGLRRIINGQPRSPHAGFDWAATRGTPVSAANAGRVALVAEHFFAGRLVALDHGLGLFTLYFHLDEARVTIGERVARGQQIGSVGATGRTTGPHLHFGVTLDGARVDPQSLLSLPLPPEASPAP